MLIDDPEHVGQVPPGDGRIPVSDALAMAYQPRLAFFQSIGMNAMYNMAYGRDCKIDIAIWQLLIDEPEHVGQVPPGDGRIPVSDALAMAYQGMSDSLLKLLMVSLVKT